MANVEYKHATCQAGQFAETCNREAADEFVVNSVIKDGNHFYVLFEKWTYESDEDQPVNDSDRLWEHYADVVERLEVLEGVVALVQPEEEVVAPAEE